MVTARATETQRLDDRRPRRRRRLGGIDTGAERTLATPRCRTINKPPQPVSAVVHGATPDTPTATCRNQEPSAT
jgi:hypothetical protein